MRPFLLLLLILLVFSSTAWSTEERLKVIPAQLSYTPDLSPRAQKEWEKGKALLADVYAGKIDPESLSDQERSLMVAAEEGESIWSVGGIGCSWYCGGGPSAVTASSALPPSGAISYAPPNAHDFDLRTAWVEGAAGQGKGEYIEYRFAPLSPRVNQIRIFNGYHKSEKAWKENGRVKRFKLHVDGQPYAILALEDSRAVQIFPIEPLGSRAEGKDLVLRFEILDVYPGDRWKDVAITEIEFDGLDVHCFVAGTLIRMADGSNRPIEGLKTGEEVLSYNISTGQVEPALIIELAENRHDHLVRLGLVGLEIISTTDHPYFVKGKGWYSADPARSRAYKGMEAVGRLRLGDEILFLTGSGEMVTRRLTSLEYLRQP